MNGLKIFFSFAIFLSFLNPSLAVEHTSDSIPKGLSGAEKPRALNLGQVSSLIQYPESARDLGIQGELPVRVLINKKGRIVSHHYPSDKAVYFRDAVEPHLRKLRFESASYYGKPMNAWVTIWFDFKLVE